MSIADVSTKSLSQLISLQGRAAVVTGAAKGIGLAICRRFAEAGADILLADIDEYGAAAAAEALSRDFGVRARARHTDVASEASVVAAADAAMDAFGRLDIWVNNAGIYPNRFLLDLSVEEWDRVQSINLRSAFLGSREAARRMCEAPMNGGVIVNVESIGSFRGHPGLGAYGASKHGMTGLAKTLAAELGPRNIRVVGIAPTGVLTPGVAAQRDATPGDELERFRAIEQKLLEAVPLRRFGVPDDVARAALFAASDMAMLVTGSTVAVDAGAMAL